MDNSFLTKNDTTLHNIERLKHNLITKRLEAILRHINEKTVADIGTDHAYIPIRLISDGICEKVIATDIKDGPVAAAKRHIEKYGFSQQIEVRKGAGLEPIQAGEVEKIVIAGMGGEMIENILRNSPEVSKESSLILQPMNNQYELRKFLINNGYKIVLEDLAAEGFKIYNIMEVKSGFDTPFSSDFDYHIPPYLKDHPLFSMLYEKKKREFKKILSGLTKATEKDNDAIFYYTENIKILEEMGL